MDMATVATEQMCRTIIVPTGDHRLLRFRLQRKTKVALGGRRSGVNRDGGTKMVDMALSWI